VNPAFEQTTGWGRDEVAGLSPLDLLAHSADAAEAMRLERALRGSGHFQGELLYQAKSGREFWVEIELVPVLDRLGLPGHFAAVKRDITARKRQELERQALEQQLRTAQKMESIGTLAGGIAHDFNNIIANILGNTELARQDMSASPQALESLEEIRKAASRARETVQQILSFSRRQPTEKKPISLRPILEESVRLLRSTLSSRVILGCDIVPETPLVFADATQIEQVIINLVTNAAQALRHEAGHIHIQLETFLLDADFASKNGALSALYARHPGTTVALHVHDDGAGMDEHTLAKIFEPFFTTKPVGEGTGLGLSVVHGIMQAHEGAIAVESQSGKGSTFSLYFPPAKILPEMKPAEGLKSIEPTVGTSLTGVHILYIDDDESLVFLVKRILERRGFIFSGFSSQREALAVLRADSTLFDLVVTDFNMPGMSGLDVAREARVIRHDLPIAIVSGFIDDALRTQAAAAGVQELIFKASAVEDLGDAFARLAQALRTPPS
jgi:PAS domain S-box-containing protein